MRWKQRRLLYQKECQAYARHIVEQHTQHIFDQSLIDEAPGKNLREKLVLLMHFEQDHVHARLSSKCRRRMSILREHAIAQALRWQRKHYPTMTNDFY